MTDSIRRYTWAEHVLAALMAWTKRAVREVGTPEFRETAAQWVQALLEGRAPTSRLAFALDTERRGPRERPGREDPRSLVLVAYLIELPDETTELCRVRVRELVDAEGNPIDVRATLRDLRAQGHQVSDEDLHRLIDEAGEGEDEG